MPIINRIANFHDDMTAWRRHLHANPETAFEEHATADFIEGKLRDFGIEVHRGLAGTGVVGSLSTGDGPAIGLRADMDALDIPEINEVPHKSTRPGKMHACGHDGHMAMLLGAARYLSETKRFKGTVRFIFQPAEENQAGGKVMVADGLFEKFPVDSVYGMHNWPGLPVGSFAVKAGPMMATADIFEIAIRGRGAHAAMPHLGIDTVAIGAEIVSALQTIVSRNADPLDAAVVSVTQFHAGDTYNVIPEVAFLRGTTRTFSPEVQDMIELSIERIARGVAGAHGGTIEFRYERRYPATINHERESEIAAGIAKDIAGAENVLLTPSPSMGAEDFAFMLQEKPGSYIWVGNGPVNGDRNLHNPSYDFNDEILPIGASYWARLVESALPGTAA